jgi:hypothetical protein
VSAHALLFFETIEELIERDTSTWWEEEYREYGGIAEETG